MVRNFILASLLIIMAGATSCVKAFGSIDGRNSPIATMQLNNLTTFTGVNAYAGFDVEYTVGQTPSVTISYSEVARDYLVAEVKDGVLVLGINNQGESISNLKLKAIVTGPDLTTITTSSGAEFSTLSPLNASALTLSSSSGSEIDLKGGVKTSSLNATASSGADIDIAGIVTATTINATASSGADIDIAGITATNVNATASSGGSVDLKGKAEQVAFTASSAGDIDAEKLVAARGTASASSGGEVESNIASASISKSSGGTVKNRR